MIRLLFAAIAVSMLALPFGARGETPTGLDLVGWRASGGDTACVPCVDDPVGSVRRLVQFGEVLGFHWGGEHPPVDGFLHHWQGVQRLYAPAVGLDGRTLVLTSNASDRAGIARVRMASRDVDGRRFRSNRLVPGQAPWRVSPAPADRIVASHVASREYKHPGGMQALGKYVLVAVERATADRERGVVACVAFDRDSTRVVWEFEAPTHAAAAVAATRLVDGRYLMIIAGQGTLRLDAYVSRSRDLATPGWRRLDTWWDAEIRSELPVRNNERTVWERYQTLNLVTDCATGTLYLAGIGGPKMPGMGVRDWVDLFRVDLEAGDLALTRVARRILFCDAGEGRMCHLQAAGGLYVDPDHRLLLYGAEHDDDGPRASVNMMEFRSLPIPGSRVPEGEAWVLLFEHTGCRGRVTVLDAADARHRQLDDLRGSPDTDRVTGSILVGMPPDSEVRLYPEPGAQGRPVVLRGNGRVICLEDWNRAWHRPDRPRPRRIRSVAWGASGPDGTGSEEGGTP